MGLRITASKRRETVRGPRSCDYFSAGDDAPATCSNRQRVRRIRPSYKGGPARLEFHKSRIPEADCRRTRSPLPESLTQRNTVIPAPDGYRESRAGGVREGQCQWLTTVL